MPTVQEPASWAHWSSVAGTAPCLIVLPQNNPACFHLGFYCQTQCSFSRLAQQSIFKMSKRLSSALSPPPASECKGVQTVEGERSSTKGLELGLAWPNCITTMYLQQQQHHALHYADLHCSQHNAMHDAAMMHCCCCFQVVRAAQHAVKHTMAR